MKKTSKSTFCLLSALFCANLSFAQDTTEVVAAWLKQNSIAIKYTEAGNSFSELQPLKKILHDVQIVGLGEATHGTREFSEMKHYLIKFLVTQMGFTAFTIESSFSDCVPINDYLLTGKGDRATVLTNQNYTAWDTEEFSAILDWMRDYNQKVPDEKKVRFYGLDVLSLQKAGREQARSYFQKYLPEKLASIDSVISVFAGEEVNWPNHMNQTALHQSFIPLNDLINYVSDNKDKLVGASSLKEWEQTHKYLEVMQQSLYNNLLEVPPSFASKKLDRDAFMWQNLQYLMEKERPDTKFMFWAANSHVSTNVERKPKSVGFYLKQNLRDKYYAISLECYEGTYQRRELLPDSSFGDFLIDTLLGVPKSNTWHFLQAGKPYFFLDLRQASSNPLVSKWLDTPSTFAAANTVARKASKKNFQIRKFKGVCEGILFTQYSTPVHPTKNALAKSKARFGF